IATLTLGVDEIIRYSFSAQSSDLYKSCTCKYRVPKKRKSLAYTPAAGTVEIRCLLKNGDIPSDELLEQIGNVLSATNIRPFTDHVIPKKPDKVDYDISIKYWISTDDKSRATLIQSEVHKALEEYKLWQRSVMGRDINPDEIISRFKNAGAKRLEITSPVFTVISEIQAARERNIECTYEGLEDG
uniref:baseplate J/gp47 family protein n=1 Tax=Salmonella enterica TaxID=28901 RepID=UPI000A6C4A4D